MIPYQEWTWQQVCVSVVTFTLIPSFPPITHHTLFYTHTLKDGAMYTSDQDNYVQNESVNIGDEWSMEVDLRSEEKEKRTLHFFVNGKQQKGFIKGVPDRVAFGV